MNENNIISQKFGTKCAKCKKTTLILTDCSCSKQFCLKCRHPEEHECSFDFKQKGFEELTKNNPVIVGKKINKI